MNDTAPHPPDNGPAAARRRPWFTRRVRRLLLAFCAAGALFATLEFLSVRTLDRALDELRRNGRPLDAAGLVPPIVPDSRNAALLYECAWLRLRSGAVGTNNLYKVLQDHAVAVLRGDAGAARREAFRDLLRRPEWGVAADCVDEAARRPYCVFPIDYLRGADKSVPHATEMLKLPRLVGAAALMRLETGDREGAWRAMESGLKLADAMRDEPVFVSQVVRLGQLVASLRALRLLCDREDPGAEESARLMAILDGIDAQQPLVRAVDGERLLSGDWAFGRSWRNGGDEVSLDVKSGSSLLWLYGGPLARLDRAAYLRFMGRQADRLSRPYHETAPRDVAADKRALPWYAMVTRALAPSLEKIHERQAECMADLRVTRTGLALLRHRNLHGAYPGALADLDPSVLPSVPPDPCTGQPLRYERRDGGFLLYSLGPDREDNSGRADKPNGWDDVKTGWDVAWERIR